MAIQSKSIRGLGAEPPVGIVKSKAPHKPGVSGGGAPLTQEIFGTFFFPIYFFAPKFDEIIFNDFFSIFLEFSETHFDLIASKNCHNIIYGDIVVYFLRIFSIKSTISQKNKNCKNQKIVFFIGFRTLRISCDNIFFGHFQWFILVNFLSIFCTKSTISQEIKIEKLFSIGFRTLHIFFDQKPNLATFEGRVVPSIRILLF